MPSFFKHHSNSNVKGVQKTHVMVAAAHKLKHTFLKKPQPQGFLNYFIPQNWFFSSAPSASAAPSAAPLVPSSVFETNDCIWYYGTLYVKETVAVARLQQVSDPAASDPASQVQLQMQEPFQVKESEPQWHHTADNADDDAESVSSGNGNCMNQPRSIAKQNQLKYLKDGMWLRHQLNDDEWCATFDAQVNRIVRAPDGVAFDTLRQFARLHCNEILATNATLTNVWSDPHFQYQDADGQWYPLSKLKQ